MDYDSVFPMQMADEHEEAANRWRKRAAKQYANGNYQRASAYRQNAERRQNIADELRAKALSEGGK